MQENEWGDKLSLCYLTNPALAIDALTALREAVGWDARKEKLELIAGRTYCTAACMDGDLLVGYVEVISDNVDDALIRNLMVHPDYQRRGIALELLKRAKQEVKAGGIKTINVLFEPELEKLYRKAGFRIILGGIIDNEKEGY